MKFAYEAKKVSGETSSGVLEAPSRFDLARLLRTNGFILTAYRETGAAPRNPFSFAARFPLPFFSSVSIAEKMIFAKNLSAMIAAGLPVVRAVETLSRQTTKKALRDVLLGLAEHIKKGKSLSESMVLYPKVFNALFVAMVRVGEEGGNLSASLMLVGGQLERDHILRRRVRGALMYPAIIVFAMFGIGALMMIYVVPTLVLTFGELGVGLPMSTRAMIAVSNTLSHHPLLSLLGVLAAFTFVSGALRTERGRRVLGSAFLRLPIFAPLVKKVNAARSARALSSLLSSGVNIIEALEITRDVLQNHRYRRVFEEAKALVQKGEPVSAAFIKNVNLYPPLVGEMLAAGEETGKMGEMLARLADFYEGEVADATKDLSTVIEPIILVLIGIGVGFFTVSMVKPLYSVLDTIK